MPAGSIGSSIEDTIGIRDTKAKIHLLIYEMRDETTIISHGTIQNGHRFLETVTRLTLTVDDVFAFFANAENPERITPPMVRRQLDWIFRNPASAIRRQLDGDRLI